MEQQFNVNVAKSRLSVGHTNNDNQFLNLWENNNTFEKANALFNKKKFVLLDGPPYANGQAHMGHALNKLFKDLVTKSRWFLGQPVHYQPGWDCHGLPLELAVEKKYGKLETSTMKKRCKQLAFRSVVKQRKTFKRLGVLGDWDKPYVTLSDDMVKESLKTVKNLFDKNLLSYKQFPVHYCPACASSLAEAELEKKLLPKDSLYFKMKVNSHLFNNLYAVVWTTTPWTLPMNQGLAYNSEFEYEVWKLEEEFLVFQNSNNSELTEYLESKSYVYVSTHKGYEFEFNVGVSPLTKNAVPVLEADFVESGKTGFVHQAFAHGPEDFELGQKNGLMPHTLLNKYGVFDVEESNPLYFLNHLKYNQVQSQVTNFLNDDNLLVSYSKAEVEQDVCWRHKCAVYFNATWQSFLKLEEKEYHLKNKVSDLLENSNVDKAYKNKLSSMLLSRSHWCLSRQREWGCPMNLLVNKETKQLDPLTSEYLAHLVDGKTELASQLLSDNPHLELFKDVLDVWFDSGNVANHFLNTNGSSETYVADLVLEGKDQFRGWFQSLLWLTVAVNGVMPYNDVFCHGFVLDENRNKLSKSLGTGSVVELYSDSHGADVLHLWTASQEHDLDPVFSKSKLEEMKRYYSRLRLGLRFTTSNLYDYDYKNHTVYLEEFKELPEWDLHRFVLSEMKKTYDLSVEYFSKYQFKKALELFYSVSDKVLSNFYYDWAKNPLYLQNKNNDSRLMTQCGLYELMLSLFEFTKVFTPFVAEEFYQDYYNNNKSVFETHYYNDEKLSFLNNLVVAYDWNAVLDLRKKVQATLEPLQQTKTVKSRTEVSAEVYCGSVLFNNLKTLVKYYRFGELFGVSNAKLYEGEDNVVLHDLKLDTDYVKCPRCWNYELVKKFNNCLCEYCFKEE